MPISLTDADLDEMKRRFEMGVTQVRLARDFGVTQGWVNQLIQRGFTLQILRDRNQRLANITKDIAGALESHTRVPLTDIIGHDRSAGRWLLYHAQDIADTLGVRFIVGHGRNPSYWMAP